jgi:ubiquinone/menaquinone biosynthesis C-methylase UbiE
MSEVGHVGMFTEVDAAEDPGIFIKMMDRVQDAPDVQSARTELLERLDLRPGHTVLDLGCGPGDHTREVAALVAPDGRAVGVDFSASMIDEATRRQEASPVPATFEQGDAQKLHFPTGTFDACRTERMLCHIPDCEIALREMVRVVRPGGRVGILDVDMAGFLIDCSDLATSAAFVTAMADAMQHPWIGRTLRRRMAEIGLVDIDVRPRLLEVTYAMVEPMIAMNSGLIRAAGVADEVLEAWRRELEYANLAGMFYMGMTVFSAVGRKP